MRGSRFVCPWYMTAIAGVVAVFFLVANVSEAHAGVIKRRGKVARRAKSAIGTPYVYGGASRSGFDCSGLTMWAFRRLHVHLPHSSMEQYLLGRRDRFKRVRHLRRLRRGDLVFFDTTGASVGHVGVVVSRRHGRFVSATSSSGVQKDSVHDPYYWGPRYVGAVRVPKLRR